VQIDAVRRSAVWESTVNALLHAGYSVLTVYMPHHAQFDIDADAAWESAIRRCSRR
jgi:hypothetical protein